MNKLILTTVLGVTLGFSSVSNAAVNIFGVETPVVKKEPRNNVKAGYVAKDLGDTFHVQQLQDKRASGKLEEKDSYIVFGVDIKSLNNRI